MSKTAPAPTNGRIGTRTLRTLASALLTLAIVACPVLCGTCWEVLGLKHAAVLGEEGGDHSPLTPANDGDDCICKSKGAVAIGCGDPLAAILEKPKPIGPSDLIDGLGLLGEIVPAGLGSQSSTIRRGVPRAGAPVRAFLQNFRC